MQQQVEMHHRAVPNAAAVESPGAYWGFDEGLGYAAGHGGQFAYAPAGSNLLQTSQKAFPIRASQPGPAAAQRPLTVPGRVPSSAQEQPEHRLRRKTPRGTIDAGYDGSPAHLVPGQPPFKHVILPAAPWQAPSQGPEPSAHQTDLTGFNLQTMVPDPAFGARNMAPSAYQPSFNVGPSAMDAVHYTGPSHHNGDNQDGFSRILERLGPCPTAYQPPQAMHMPGYYPLLARSPQENIQHPFGGPFNDDFAVPRGVAYGHTPGDFLNTPLAQPHQHTFPQPFQGLAQGSNFQNSSQGVRHSTHPNLSGGPPAGIASSMQAPSFQQKALAMAHDVYLQLMAQRHARKAHSSKLSPNNGGSLKTFIHPKLPPQFASHPRLPVDTRMYPPLPLGSGGVSELQPPNQNGAFNTSGRGSLPHLSGLTPHGPPFQENDSWGAAPSGWDRKGKSLASDVQKPSKILFDLCEQSNWKWVDGMLLSGCLCYSVEDYEGALEWFYRIHALDQRHLETHLNIAATMYCLNRQADAEKHWLRAIKINPRCLEAVEHLVGLLYKKRSREAVDVIRFVQKSLSSREDAPAMADTHHPASLHPSWKSTPQSSSATARDGTPGYGSSGYSLPGCDNGRMLALIHAKGTMLYGLKDVGGAAEAFEEAVLISAGREIRGINNLVRRIHQVLSPDSASPAAPNSGNTGSLLLPPQRARHTAQFVFPPSGELPGIQHILDGVSRQAAIQTTSNSLLSLAKIFQDAMSTGTSTVGRVKQLSGVGDILALYYLSLSLQDSPSTANNVGILLASVQQPATSHHARPPDFPLHANIPGIIPGSGLSLALAYYHYGLTLDPKHVHLHTNLGSLLKDIGQLDLAIQMYEQAVVCDGTFDIALTNLANAVKDRGRIGDAIMYYKRAVNSNPDFAEAVCGLATALNSVCDWRARGGVLLAGGKYDRWHVNEEGMLQDVLDHGRGSGLMNRVVTIVQRQLDDSAAWGCGVLHEHFMSRATPQLQRLAREVDGVALDLVAEVWGWSKHRWEGARLVRLVERVTRSTMWLWYRDKHVLKRESPSGYPRLRLPASLTVPTAPTVLPFHTFTCPLSARDIRLISQRNALRISCSTLRSPWLPASVYPPPPPPNPQLKVGYVSSDFNNHPLAHLMQSVFGFHDRAKVTAFCYATTTSDQSVHRQKIEREAPVFRDASGWSPDRLVGQIVQDGIHILINLNGYTRGARNEIFAARPVPIQMSFMGFAGTLGAEWCDYILADSTAIPHETLRPWRRNRGPTDLLQDHNDDDKNDWMYSENIIFCRDTFFCCDHAQSSPEEERRVTWIDEQRRRWEMRKLLFPNLPDNAIILGNFNQLYKMDPTTFRSWLRILSHVPNAFLWLLRFPDLGESHLRRTAVAWAGAHVANRIIFTDVAPKSQHISRGRVCDLFLDTPECNAHTTAADVLWSSTPLLTLPRYSYKMCSRMAASILRGALPRTEEGARVADELIVGDDEQYERAAVELASGLSYSITRDGYGAGRGRLAEMRRMLFESRWTCALFDTRRWVGDVERAYEEAWRKWVSGEAGDIYL